MVRNFLWGKKIYIVAAVVGLPSLEDEAGDNHRNYSIHYLKKVNEHKYGSSIAYPFTSQTRLLHLANNQNKNHFWCSVTVQNQDPLNKLLKKLKE